MDEFTVKSLDEIITGIFKPFVDALKNFCEKWLQNVKPKTIKRGKAPARAKIVKYKKVRNSVTQRIKVLLLDKRTKVYKCRNHCRKYGRQIYN